MTKWVLEKNNSEIIDEIEYSDEDYKINGAGDILWNLIPADMANEAEKGEWDQEGYNWIYKGDFFIIKTLKQN